ncbi:MAG: Phenylalanine-tRNA ligase alpha subunit [Candidatus Magasanikbacteria bacterium GW2011_GWA2_45_39]|uniref:Phenylalanine--tRNA ligase alpha subunit n=1 Tax=Candidatus Magasanikbacteria bacterium GW2011_GWA2_45_39 TaxID=1619041 RepID=A0A0G1PQS7_9BACT|nr:MAG: Phenylalanine-tRNA ligase alpha subunit [Candidatus Magasanikbacteria bacterium GW2011_GWA2_45_39]HBW74082.1 phenylalanine--tRNA ligase subunit alpha [Candidatus Magasanikbacteria bacterium]
MEHSLKALQEKAHKEIAGAKDANALEAVEIKYMGRAAGEITAILKNLKDVPAEERPRLGALANEIKQDIEAQILERREALLARAEAEDTFDVTESYVPRRESGTLHPTTQIQYELEDFFAVMGFRIIDGPELESDFYNFSALNIAPDHPARDMQDTLYIKDHPTWLMRTHTSSMQVRIMREFGACNALYSGRCFRNEATDARHEHTFHQLEGFVVGEDISFAHLKGILDAVARHLYGEDTQVRLRPKYYPFVEPGVSGEVTCAFCASHGCTLCKQTGWLEIFGAGLIHPHVLKEGGLDPKQVSGLAFGFGLTRLAMLKYGINDVRLFLSADMQFLKQF